MNLDVGLLDDISRAAEISALRVIRAKLEKPENLETLEQLRTAAARRKRTLDEELRIAFQSPLESIRTGMTELQLSLDNMKTVEQTMGEADEKLQKMIPLQSKFGDLLLEANIYRQLSLAQANLDYIIKTPENVRKADELLERDRLLQAHQLIMEIENARNYLLLELHAIKGQDSQSDNVGLVNNYFADCERLVAHLRRSISFRISRWYDCVGSAPEELVTALRIVNREEQVDRFWLEKKDLTGFSPPDRPRQWEKFCFELLKKSVKDRIEGNQLETREEHKYWLTRHLEMCRKRFLKDFQIITKVCHRIFPKHYDIVNRFLDYYHNCLKEYLTEICDPKRRTENDTLTTAEIYAIFTFIRDYHGTECLGNPELNLDISQLSPLLEKDVLSAIIDVFINERKEKFTEWTRKIVSLEVKDWHTRKEVELTAEHYYMTTMPRMLMNMIIETLDMAKQMSNETCQLILYMVIQKLNEFRDLYVTEMNNYATRYFNNRDEFRENFTKQMIANANNCESIPYSMLIIREKYDQSQLFRYESVGKKFEHTAEYCCEIIIQEMEIDTVEFLKFLFTRNWLGSAVNPYCRKILEITQHYWNSKLTYLKKSLLAYLFHTWHKRILAYYLRNLFSRTTTIKLTTPLERRTCAEQLRKEAAMLEKEFILWDGTSAENATKYHFNILSHMADILEQTDLDYIGFDIGTLAKKYPSLTIDQIQRVLLLRGDLSKQQAKDKADAALANMPRVNEGILFEIMEIVNQLNQRSLK